MFEGLIANKLANKMMEEDLYKIVKRHAFWGALVMILPLFGFDWIVFCAILWRMYNKICLHVGTTLKFSTIAAGFIVYAQFYFSGKAYIETLKRMHL